MFNGTSIIIFTERPWMRVGFFFALEFSQVYIVIAFVY